MLGWIIGAGGLLVAAWIWAQNRSGPARAPLALPPSPLVERLGPLLRAGEAVRDAARVMTPEDLLLCALPEAIRQSIEPGEHMVGTDGSPPRSTPFVGPGQQVFIDLHEAVAGVDEDDRRVLAETGFDLARLGTAAIPSRPAEAWAEHLLLELEAMTNVVGQVRHQPYR